jgi:hypothetical protein
MYYLESHLKVVGTRPIRPDGVDKVVLSQNSIYSVTCNQLAE